MPKHNTKRKRHFNPNDSEWKNYIEIRQEYYHNVIPKKIKDLMKNKHKSIQFL